MELWTLFLGKLGELAGMATVHQWSLVLAGLMLFGLSWNSIQEHKNNIKVKTQRREAREAKKERDEKEKRERQEIGRIQEDLQQREDAIIINAGPHARMCRFVRTAPAKYKPFNQWKLHRCIASYPERANITPPHTMEIWSNAHIALYHIRQHLTLVNARITCVMDKDNEATPLEVLDVRHVPSLLTNVLEGRNANVLHFPTFLQIAKNVSALESMWVTAWGDTRIFLENTNLLPLQRGQGGRVETKMTLARLKHLEGEIYPTEIDHDQCITCSNNRKDVLFQDCGHVLLCVHCVKKLRALRCPMCQAEVTQMPRPGIRY